MSEPFLGEIRMFAGNFAPRGWALCQGQLLPISQNTALFSLLGTYYGGNGQSTFALPDLRGRAPIHQGQGPSLTLRNLGEQVGTESVTLIYNEMPAHTHIVMGVAAPGNSVSPAGGYPAVSTTRDRVYSTSAPDANPTNQLPPAGGGQPHNNLMPYLTVNFIIAMEGVFPARS
jgi:microcystin-dependent protein